MRIAFFDFIDWDYTIETAYQRPLGGSQSALCYLAEALAAAGHDVWLLNHAAAATEIRGVHGLPYRQAEAALLRSFDCGVVLNTVQQGADLRRRLAPAAPLILWIQHAHDQPASRKLASAEIRQAYDAYAFVSRWQREQFVAAFDLPAARCMTLRNAAGPRFATMFDVGQPLPADKLWPPKLIYTSTPFRGLDLLLAAFPAIRAAVPEATLRVFSSLQVYQADAAAEERYSALYAQCRSTPGVEYAGSVPQPALAEQMRGATMLAYPNHFPETSCIAVIEALAAGCIVVTSDLAALPETAAGFGRLIPVDGDRTGYIGRFVEATVAELRAIQRNPAAADQRQRSQISQVQQTANWSVRAHQWSTWLEVLSRS